MQIAVTGANGFVGTALCSHLAKRQHRVIALLRSPAALNQWPEDSNSRAVSVDYNDDSSLLTVLAGCDVVVHLIARTHSADSADALRDYLKVNLELSERIAKLAARAGIRRLVYLSSIKALGEATCGTPFSSGSEPQPTTPYGISKLETEQRLQELCQELGMELTVVRPPLIYAAHAKGNIHTLRRALEKGLPLPLASIHNHRSIVTLPHLCELLRHCCELPQMAGQTLLTSDCPTLSTPQLVRKIAADIGRPARLLPIPPALLRLAARCVGKKEMADRLLGDLEVDDSATRKLLESSSATQGATC
ncbi:NAD-dependent epimerase/dehydratase family protein [Pseudomaricurvus sp. HS19]|uniref:NAD-dependent epimerase/dehydratase family protein n=1 Tax=Pseudomaricurvus sp. HS19 TaxID=2692626 RepID=UPI00136DADC7|nr:NAD-dependent epimerase/dehydratase family protein [Pseudomaricurvus sp. HS19]MYM62850.1 NAD-dependent epimerase/dehydratase family protein [Pseudomaricurvus sp. HS19]